MELDGLIAREHGGRKVILPVWHNVDFGIVARYSPMLADRVGVSTTKGIETVVTEICEVLAMRDKESQRTVAYGNFTFSGSTRTYYNARFGFEVTYPADWFPGKEADNGDGLELYVGNPDVDIRVYGCFILEGINEELEPLTADQRIQWVTLESGHEARVDSAKAEGTIFLRMTSDVNPVRYTLEIRTSQQFYEKHESTLRELMQSFKITGQGEDGIIG